MKRHILSILAFAAVVAAHSVPANRRPFVFRQPDGTKIVVTLVGDEYEHHYLTSAGEVLYAVQRADGLWLLTAAEARDGHESSEAADQPDLTTRRDGLRQARAQAEAAAAQAATREAQAEARQASAEISATPTAPSEAQAATRHDARRATALGGYPTLGSPRELVLLVEYPDCRFTHSADTFRRMLTEEGYADDGATGSARDYFADQSRGLFTPDIEVVGPIMLPHPRAYYGSPTANMYDGQPWLMLTDAAPQVDDAVDFSQFDNDGDGFVDNVFIFYAGMGQNDGGPLEAVWPHAANIWTYYALDCTLDGVKLGSYACTNEVTGAGRLTGIGTFCHEYSHVLGLPDLYSTQGASACFSPGAFELMDSGSYNNEGRTPPNMSAYDRAELLWCDPEPLGAPETVILPPDGSARSLSTVKAEEYYLLENRQQTGWDAYLPAHGMLVWHIDYDARAWADNQVNVLPGHQRVDLVEADGVLTKETQDGDAFPGSRQTTSLNLVPWTGVPLDAAITEIRESPLQLPPSAEGQETTVVTFKFRGGGERIEAPVALEAREMGPCGFGAAWTGVPAVTDYEVVVWHGHEVAPLDVTSTTAHAEPDGIWTATVTGLAPATTYRYAVVARDGERRSPHSNEVTLTTLPPTFGMLAPQDLAVSTADGDGWLLQWTALDEAASYEVEMYGHRVVAPDVVALDFTGGVAALPAGWTTTSTQTSGVAGTFGAARPSLLLLPGEYLQSPVFDRAITDFDFWSLGHIVATTDAAGGAAVSAASATQLRLTNAGDAVAYVDDVTVSYGGVTEQTDMRIFTTDTDNDTAAAATTHAAAAQGATQLVLPATEGEWWARVRGVRGDGERSAWSDEVQLPNLTGIRPVTSATARTTWTLLGTPLPHSSTLPAIVVGSDGRKQIGQ